MEELFEVAGESYYFDLNEISNFIRLEKEEDVNDLLEMGDENTPEAPQLPDEGPMIDMIKWEMTKGLIETVLTETSSVDEAMGYQNLGTQLSIPFRISFNTLLINKLIKKQ